LLAGAISLLAADRTFTNRQDHFVVRYPDSWHPFISENIFCIGSFPASKGIPVYQIPRPNGGAEIIMVTARHLPPGVRYVPPRDIEAWVSQSVTRYVARRRALKLEIGNRSVDAREVVTDDLGGQESVEWYFELDGEFFKALVFYWKGDPGVSEYVKVLNQVASTIRVTQ
jgi:hypothetical protein